MSVGFRPTWGHGGREGGIKNIEKWGNLDLNQGPVGYEDLGLLSHPILFNRSRYDDRGVFKKNLLNFAQLY